jgi:hypothetical protein
VQDARYDRQVRLREVGEEGQRRIGASRLSVGKSSAARVERLYLERAGAFEVSRRDVPDVPFKHEHVFEHDRTRTFGAGAWRALKQLERVLER